MQMQLSEKLVFFVNLLLHLCYLHQILKILKKKKTFMAYVVPKLLIAKDVVR